jgi:hypothetical protein
MNRVVPAVLVSICAAGAAWAGQENTRPRTSFESVDLDKDGFVTAEEAFVIGVSQEKFDAADGDHDGKLDSTEYSIVESEIQSAKESK